MTSTLERAMIDYAADLRFDEPSPPVAKTRMAGLATPSHEKVRRHEGGSPGCAGFQPARAGGRQWTMRRRPAMVHAGWKPAHPGTLLLVCAFSR